ncbi:NADH-quinone oxidoreductase subunit NuoH [Thermomicrobium roseum]|jgi:NADH-quinone oxidoreductase subunit H|uniref:NADH-quinone oxidoreductase subunit H n=1 Tax=Thermomicrobium roseum (strain ATCC 27502 / DSM 5159 / P-2) TaxID=309801 RepID=NUOH_THERP|nr:NADH-quinone oxidoreductase subunit NuoH [Thermomicrobium roseum]B9L173.1 RecName: Full=NADH-quinone oxidoreductase subunit H; AltName: Full=NADH dehydrogenase I subunit H; AltName: Full=NDH-1 subunit H [Thermomicrobium roseum DSM 5159]ACM05186.1 nadh-quinone oxidoreductase chain h [Thermomicrobium roseum DSM 5159]MBO9403722.1 NADH-quinone oxidoreductase subunit NuoH [Thermomicrobium sp.]
MDWQRLIVSYLVGFVLLNVLLGLMAYMTWFERRVLARMQHRVGPNRTGPFGLLQPIADGIKLLAKEDIVPANADRLVFLVAPLLSFALAPLGAAVIPFGDTLQLFGIEIPLLVADINVAVLYVLALGSVGVYGIILGGYASGNRYSLLGALRSTAQVISYELVLGLSLVGVFILSGSLSLQDILREQQRMLVLGPLTLPNWYILSQPLAFALFLIAAVAETNRAPFDLPEAETELVAGYFTEYSGFRFSFYFLAEYINMIVVSLLAATLFLGGIDGPFADGVWWLALKALFFLFFYVWLRATLPRFRYDQLMGLAWKVLLPLALLNIGLTGLVRLWGIGAL